MKEKILKGKRITVLLGGTSKEREVSLRSGRAVSEALKKAGCHVRELDPKVDPVQQLSPQNTDAVFIVLHGHYGEDGSVQAELEKLNIPYTGSGVAVSELCFDKIRTKKFVIKHQVPTPRFWVYEKQTGLSAFLGQNHISPPVVTKPSRGGSTIGMRIVWQKDELEAAIEEALGFCNQVLIEEYIQGKEVTVGVLNGKALPSVEIVPASGFYDYEAKYTVGRTSYFVPARIPGAVASRLSELSEKIVHDLGCRGAPRLDYMLSEKNEIYFLEVNTIPGMTETSLLPKAARQAGIDFVTLCERILMLALV